MGQGFFSTVKKISEFLNDVRAIGTILIIAMVFIGYSAKKSINTMVEGYTDKKIENLKKDTKYEIDLVDKKVDIVSDKVDSIDKKVDEVAKSMSLQKAMFIIEQAEIINKKPETIKLSKIKDAISYKSDLDLKRNHIDNDVWVDVLLAYDEVINYYKTVKYTQ